MTLTLIQAQVQIDHFLEEAMECAENGFGFAAMLTVFPVILGVSEALSGGRKNVDDLFQTFVNEMNDTSSWIDAPQSVGFSSDQIVVKLVDVRNGLTHQFSLPTDVLLIKNQQDAQKWRTTNPDKCLLYTVEFVDAAKRTVSDIIAVKPDVQLDPNPPGSVSREAAGRLWPLNYTSTNPASGVLTE